MPGRPVSEDPDEWLFRPIETAVAAHHLLLLRVAERTIRRRHGRAMFFLPPGSAKSTYVSVVTPAWVMGRWPGSKIILCCYGSDLARRHGRRARQLCRSDRYYGIFGAGISAFTSAADEWALDNGSEYLAAGLLAGITGNRAHGAIVDDPVKGRQEADSAAVRASVRAAYEDDLLTRLIPGGWVILVMTRWHQDDLAGALLPKGWAGESGVIRCNDGHDWEVLCIPAQADRADDPLGRRIGEYLWPEWFDEKHWAQFRQNPRTWNALYQQRPTPAEGGIFRPEWFRRYTVIPVQANLIVHTWDTANKPQQINDPSVGQAWAVGTGCPGYYLRCVLRERMEYPRLKRTVINWAERDRPVAVLIEDKASGQQLIQDLRSETRIPVVPVVPDADKLTRASTESPAVEAGHVYLPERAPWLADFESEVFGYPLGVAHDDQVDAMTQFLRWARAWSGRLESYASGRSREYIGAGVNVRSQDEVGYGSVSGAERAEGF